MNRPALLLAAALAAAMTVPVHHATAQIAVGASVGRVFDTQDDWLVFGVEARMAIKGKPFEFNPRLTHNPAGCCSTTQVDANLLYRPELAGSNKFQPFVGAGVAFVHEAFDGDSENKAAFNAVAGLEVNLEGSRLRPFVHAQYTAAKDFGNTYTMAVGLVFPLK